MPGATVLRVARVQNRHLWEQYRHRELQSDTLWTMRWMWLGTFKTPPSEVVSGVDGLSMCGLPGVGRYGRGVDFAEHAIDFHRRAYASGILPSPASADGTAPNDSGDWGEAATVWQLVLCRVLCGPDDKPVHVNAERRSGVVVHVTSCEQVYPAFVVSYTRSGY